MYIHTASIYLYPRIVWMCALILQSSGFHSSAARHLAQPNTLAIMHIRNHDYIHGGLCERMKITYIPVFAWVAKREK